MILLIAFYSVLLPLLEFNINPAIIVHLLNSQECILAVQTCQIKQQITFASYWVPIYTPGSRAAMWIKCHHAPPPPSSRLGLSLRVVVHNRCQHINLDTCAPVQVKCVGEVSDGSVRNWMGGGGGFRC